MPLSLDSALGVHAQALKLRAQRAELLATNLAHSDTPNYKARDLDFKAALATAQGDGTLHTTHARHLSAGGVPAGQAGALYRVPPQAALDGNTVDTQQEKAEFARNAVQYQASLSFLTHKIRGLMGALRGE